MGRDMTAPINQQRVGELVLELMPETDIGEEPSGWASPVRAVVNSIDLSSAVPQEIEDPAMRYDGGGYPSAPGLVYPGANVPISMKMEGVETVPIVGSAPDHTFQTRMMATAYGHAGTALKRSLCDTGCTATSVVEKTDDAHAPSSGGYTFVAPAIGGKTYPRPGIYTAATDTTALAIALPSAPAEDADNAGGILFQYEHNPSSPPTVAIRAVGNDTQQNRGIQGVIATLEIPEIGPDAVPVENYSCKVADATYDQSGWTRTPATNTRARVLAGAEVILCKVGSTAGFKYPVRRVAAQIRGSWEPIDTTDPDAGIAGYGPGAGLAGYVDLTLPHNADPDDVVGAVGYTSWEDFWRDNLGEQFQVLIVIGKGGPGHGTAHYLPRANVKMPASANVNGFDCRKLRFEPAAKTAADVAAGLTHEWIGYKY